MTLPYSGLLTQPRSAASQHFDRWGHVAVAVVLVLVFVAGGGSRAAGTGDVLTQLLALPLGLWAIFSLHTSAGSWIRRAALAVALLVVGTLVIQQLPLPESLWRAIDVRDVLAQDLAIAGVDNARHVWSLSPLASERGLWSILPALAVFLGVLAVPVRQHRRLLLLVVGLSTASLILGFLQLGAPQDSVLNPFPDRTLSLNGFFANANHQATALAISIVILVALWVSGRAGDPDVKAPPWARFSMIALAAVLFAALPLTGSRAVLLLAVIALAAVALILRPSRSEASNSSAVFVAGSRGLQIVMALLALGVVLATVGWLRHDIAEETRWAVAQVTFAMGWAHAAPGAGVGSFVPWFEQAAPALLVREEYYNHAHNEYAQWWLESGVLGAASVLAVIALLLACYPRRAAAGSTPSIGSGDTDNAGGDRGVAAAAWLGCALIMAHSWVDYPLRMPTLSTIAGLLAGIVVAQRIASGSRILKKKSGPSRSSQRA